jgi:hypothetical protein
VDLALLPLHHHLHNRHKRRHFTLSQRNKQNIDKEHKANVRASADADAEAELPSKTPMVATPEAKKGNSEIQVVEVGTDAHMTAGTE